MLTNSLTVELTAAHSNLGAVSLSLVGPGGPYAFDLNPSSPRGRGRELVRHLYVTVLLTTGDSDPAPLHDYIAFCKGAS